LLFIKLEKVFFMLSRLFQKTRTWRYLAVTVSLMSGLAGIPAQAQEKPQVIRVGTTAPGHLKFLLSRDQKFFDAEFVREGIKVEYLAFTGGGSEVATALATGSIDIAYTGASPALRLAAKKANVKFVGISSVPTVGSYAIIVAPNSPYKTLADLKGKKVAYLAGTIRHSVLVKALQASGLGIKDLDSLNMPFEASAPALSRGDIDALIESDITVAPLIEKGIARLLFDNSKRPDWEVPLVITTHGPFAKNYPQYLKRFLKVDRQINQWANANFETAAGIYAKARNTSVQAVQKEYPGNKVNDDPRITDEIIKNLKAEEVFMREAGLLNGSVDFSSWVDRSYVEAAYTGPGAQ
jgi:sulfonate transport system substrate-binding protein